MASVRDQARIVPMVASSTVRELRVFCNLKCSRFRVQGLSDPSNKASHCSTINVSTKAVSTPTDSTWNDFEIPLTQPKRQALLKPAVKFGQRRTDAGSILRPLLRGSPEGPDRH